MKAYVIGVLSFICCFSCNTIENSEVYCEKTIPEMIEISKSKGKPFCIMLYDSARVSSTDYLIKIKDNSQDGETFNFINIAKKENKWYEKLLSPDVLPVACVFTPLGELVELIPGNSKESVLYLREAFVNQRINGEFHYNQRYGDEKNNLISNYNAIFQLKQRVDMHENVLLELNDVLSNIYYPFPLFLKLQNHLQLGDSITAKDIAEELLQFDSPSNLVDYYEEFMFAQKVIDPAFSMETGQYIEVNPTEIELINCKKGEGIPILINIKNSGHRYLKISDVLMSCTCVKLNGDKQCIIAPQQAVTLAAEFTPDEIGEIYRELYIVSNAVNSPVYYVQIKASVN